MVPQSAATSVAPGPGKVEARQVAWKERVALMGYYVAQFNGLTDENWATISSTMDSTFDYLLKGMAVKGMENIFEAKALPIEIIRYCCMSSDPGLPSPPDLYLGAA